MNINKKNIYSLRVAWATANNHNDDDDDVQTVHKPTSLYDKAMIVWTFTALFWKHSFE